MVLVAKNEVTLTNIFDGQKGVAGADGVAGKDGVGLQSTVITYASSSSGTNAPSSGWASSVPTVPPGQYLWTKTVWNYSDSTSETGYSVARIGKDGNNGTDGIAGKDGVGIVSTTITYGRSTSGASNAGITWASSVPSVPPGQYLWTKTVWTYTDNTSETGFSVAKMGEAGPKGDKGEKGDQGKDGLPGAPGVGIKSTVSTYGLSSNETTQPATWSVTVPPLTKGQFLWTKTVWTYTDNSTETGYTKTYIAKDGNNGSDGIAGKDGVGIKTTTITYAKSTNGTTAPTSGWTTSVPITVAGDYIWTKTVWTYSDNTTETGYSVGKIGNTGPKGDTGADGLSTYTHVAYARLDKSNEIGFGRDITTGRPYNGSTVKRTGGVSFTTSGGTSVGKHIIKALGTTGLNGWLYLKVRNTHNATTLVVRLNGMTGSSVKGSYTVLPGKDLTILAPVKCQENHPSVHVSFETHSTRVTDELSYDVYEIGLYPSSPFVDFSHSPVATSTHVGIYTDDLEASSNDISKYEWSSYVLSADDSSGVTNYAEDRDFELGRWKHSSGNLSSGGSASADYQDGVATVVLNSTTGWSQIQMYSRSYIYESESYSSTALNNLRLWDTYTLSVYVRFNTTPGPGIFACVRDNPTTGYINQINLSPTGLQLSNMVAGEWYLLSGTFVLQGITNYLYRRIILGLNGYNGSVSFKKPEVTKTTKYVDAGPAPEDSNTKVADKVSTTELDERINETSEDIRLAYEAAIADAILKQAYSWEEEFRKYKNSVAAANTAASKEYADAKKEVVAHKTALENGKIQWEGLNNFIEFTKNGNMIIRDKNGSGGAGLMIDSDTISFMSNDQRVSYYSSGELFVERGVFTTSTRTGRFIEMQSPSNPDSNVIRYVGP